MPDFELVVVNGPCFLSQRYLTSTGIHNENEVDFAFK